MNALHNVFQNMRIPAPSSSINHGRDTGSPTPLAFDRVNEGRPFTGNSILTRFPIELTWYIIQQVPKADLASFAQVSRDCRQLARSRQFASITLDYSDASLGVLKVLVKEALERLSNEGRTKMPSLGACIRRITVATNPVRFTRRNQVERLEESQEQDASEQNRRVQDACTTLFDHYVPNITLILSSPFVLPHLDTLDWQDPCQADEQTLQAIIMSGAKHIKIRTCTVDKNLTLDFPPGRGQSRITSLNFDIRCKIQSDCGGTLSPLICSILSFVATTVESLSCCSYSSIDNHVLLADCVNGRPTFPKLQDLKIQWLTEYDPAWLEVLIQPGLQSPIRSLDIDPDKNPAMRKFFRSCGRLPHLETLVWRFSSREDVDMKFLSDNCHIRKLMVHGPVNSRVLGNQLLPTLSRSFRYLTSLSLFWDDFTVSQQSLNLISTLTSLEQLRLGALTSSGWDCEWVIDHYAIQTALRPLIRLRKLALNRDTYEVYHDLGYGDVDPVHYYEMQRPRSYQVLLRVAYEETDADRLLFDEFLKEKWEEQHRQDMLCIASQYGDIFPELEWIFLGQLPMEIEVGKSGKKNVVLLSYDRNHCDALQQQMFGRAQELSS